ncbi:MAG: translation elongation factor Ts [Deltaproteobacteria bacterium]|nr:translation elongation factor Ts [Deltaproteobacteria bacterium]
MEISAAQVRDLREKTGAGIMDCKKALGETGGDLEKAVDYLRQKGLAAASKKAGRAATEGLIGSYIHGGGKIGVLVEVNCETDFVARNEDFQTLVKDVAMHIAAANPLYVSRDEISAELIEKEKEIFKAQALESGKPENIVEKIVAGRVDKFCAEISLMEQAFVKNPDITVEHLLKESISKIGENISIRRFSRFHVGEGMEKKESNLAEEVAAQLGG